MIQLDRVKAKIKLKQTLILTKVREYEEMEAECKRLQRCLQDRGQFITQLNEEVTALCATRDQLMNNRPHHETLPPL